MKILFINPPFTQYGGVEGQGGKSTPLNLAYLASYLIGKGYNNVRILDAEAQELPYKDICSVVKKVNPDIVAMTLPTPVFDQVQTLSVMFKKINPKIKIIVGGPHPSALPKQTLNDTVIDYLILGEGELTIYELVKELEKIKPNLKKIDGIAYRSKNNQIIITNKRKLIKDLDSIPFPARHLLPYHLYFAPPTKRVSNFNGTSMVSSRGCPYECTYCVSAVVWGRGCRFRSANSVVDEMEECVKKYNLAEFNFPMIYLQLMKNEY